MSGGYRAQRYAVEGTRGRRAALERQNRPGLAGELFHDTRLDLAESAAADNADGVAGQLGKVGTDEAHDAADLLAPGVLVRDAALDNLSREDRHQEGDAADDTGDGDDRASEADPQPMQHHLEGDPDRQFYLFGYGGVSNIHGLRRVRWRRHS